MYQYFQNIVFRKKLLQNNKKIPERIYFWNRSHWANFLLSSTLYIDKH